MNIKEFLTGCGVELTAEQETKLNADFPKQFKPAEVYNTDVKKNKDLADTYKQQLDDANIAIQGFKDLDVDGIKKAANDWETKYNTDKANWEKQLSDRDYEDAARAAIADVKFTSKAAKNAFLASLKANPLPLKDGKLLGFDDVLTAAKADDASAFAGDKEAPKFTDPITGKLLPEITKEAFAKMGYMDKLKIKTEQPELYKGLVQK